jgi:hypothetical protein
MRRRNYMVIAAGVLILAVIISATLLGCGGDEQVYRSAGDGEASKWNSAELEEDLRMGEEAQTAGESYATQPSATDADIGSTLPQLQLKVIKTSLMNMETGKGEYARIREDAVAIASSVGGFVESESSSKDDEGLTYATLTLRVPSDSFDDVVSRVSDLGDVTSNQVSTEDVSSEYVDLEGRIRHLQAEEQFYMTLIGRASTIQEMITIREHLDSIQLQREQAQGRLNFLDGQISYSTLTLSIDEVSDEEKGDEEGFWHSLGEAFSSFGRGMGKLAIGFFYALPYLLVMAAIAAVIWLIARRHTSAHKRP